MRDAAFESHIQAFEDAWRRGAPSAIAGFLDALPSLTAESRLELLIELVAVDLEYRWRSPHSPGPAHLEHYLTRFPELLDQPLVDLVGEEYRVRRQWGDRPSHAEFLARFPAKSERVGAVLRAIDAALADETADPRHILRPLDALAHDAAGIPWIPLHDIILQRMIGAGRTGKVYRARQRSAGRDVAVKFLRKSLVNEPRVVRRFVGEAETVALLRHPNIVGTHGLGRTDAGAYFLVMDLVTGASLAQLSRAGPIRAETAVSWAIALCDALEHAHSRGIIHCDLKPANILLADDGTIRVTDFGLARSLHEQTAWTADVEGTAPFMAPEQVSEYWGAIDPRTDVYGVGAVLYTLLTGRPPWIGNRLPDILARVVSAVPVIAPAVLRPELEEPLSTLCGRCLAKPPAERYATVAELRLALQAMSEGRLSHSRAPLS